MTYPQRSAAEQLFRSAPFSLPVFRFSRRDSISHYSSISTTP